MHLHLRLCLSCFTTDAWIELVSSLEEFLQVERRFGDVVLFGASDAELEGSGGRTREGGMLFQFGSQLLLIRLVTCRDAEVPRSVVVTPDWKLDHTWMVYSSWKKE
ncbi:hypothetical protein RHGRI_024487 [Rhododendron griersonianum]|uniref:Uncharacterized protein n=1 Tax=Rhododendron griersonianum TaxID=479676 RepID=A0AAV6J9V0_9ERIC|nr:hypothetical protein RHGRI_024487 [Rhododendron griersonianum]